MVASASLSHHGRYLSEAEGTGGNVFYSDIRPAHEARFRLPLSTPLFSFCSISELVFLDKKHDRSGEIVHNKLIRLAAFSLYD